MAGAVAIVPNTVTVSRSALTNQHWGQAASARSVSRSLGLGISSHIPEKIILRVVSPFVCNVASEQSSTATGTDEKTNGRVTEILSPEDFQSAVTAAGDKLVVLYIATKTCGPCRFIFPKLVDLSVEYEDVVFLKINGDNSPETRALMRAWTVRAVPNFRFFRHGELVHQHTGAKEDELCKYFLQHYTPQV
eukprot:TRINITY_DN919_c0_g1_i1.p1 TRINITY_DN919_c0_g1~~TRINITY_DN919_c0_g1_i1.p1  ORF type:complete len:216 (-),score=28.74 TRINITY_DN919_c0_g1_i1:343-915(-)